MYKFKVDSNSFIIGLDNNAFTFTTKHFNHIIRTNIPTKNQVVKGYGGTIKVRDEGTIKWKVEDYNENIKPIIIQNVKYASESTIRLLSIHQWSQQASNNYPKTDVTW